MIETKIAGKDDASQIRLIRELSFATVRDIYRPRPNISPINPQANGRQVDILASLEGCYAGVIGTSNDGACLSISGLAVLPKFRQRGVAKSLLAHASNLALENACRSMRLFTIRETGNVAIFERLGFSVVEETDANWCVSDRFQTLHETTMLNSVD